MNAYFAFSPDGHVVAATMSGKIHSWSFPLWRHQKSIPISRMTTGARTDFSPDGTLLFANQYEGVRVLKAKDW